MDNKFKLSDNNKSNYNDVRLVYKTCFTKNSNDRNVDMTCNRI